jgi:hypothetical protein
MKYRDRQLREEEDNKGLGRPRKTMEDNRARGRTREDKGQQRRMRKDEGGHWSLMTQWEHDRSAFCTRK